MNNLQNFKDYLLKQQIDFEESVSLKKKTWIKRGGVTNFWVLHNTENKLSSI